MAAIARWLILAMVLCLAASGPERDGISLRKAAVTEVAEVRQLRGTPEGGDPETAELQQLRNELQEEQARSQIAGYASVAAIRNATKEAKKLHAAEAALAKAQPAVDEAQASLTKAQQRIKDLEALLALAHQEGRDANNSAEASAKHAGAAAAHIKQAQAAQAEAEARAKAAEEKEAQEEQAVQAANEGAKAATQREAALKAAADAARRRASEPRVPPVGDFALIGFLRACPYQPVLALVLGVAGLLSIADGAQFFQILCVSTFAAATGTCVSAELSAFGGEPLGLLANVAAGSEAALVAAVACYYGMDGLQILAGALLGLAFAYATCGHFIEDSPENRLAEAAWYAVATLIGAVAMFFGDRHAQAVVGPLSGGLLFASFAVYVAAFLASSSDASSAKFLDFVQALLSGRGALDMFGQQGTAVWIGGASIWMVVFLLGLSRHFLQWPSCSKKSSNDDDRRRSKRSSRSDQTAPLLPSTRSAGRSVNPYDQEPVPSSRSSSRPKKGMSRKEQYNMYGQVGDVPENIREIHRYGQARDS